jgi:hypothetical protein
MDTEIEFRLRNVVLNNNQDDGYTTKKDINSKNILFGRRGFLFLL